jgi:hypothetical protein
MEHIQDILEAETYLAPSVEFTYKTHWLGKDGEWKPWRNVDNRYLISILRFTSARSKSALRYEAAAQEALRRWGNVIIPGTAVRHACGARALLRLGIRSDCVSLSVLLLRAFNNPELIDALERQVLYVGLNGLATSVYSAQQFEADFGEECWEGYEGWRDCDVTDLF